MTLGQELENSAVFEVVRNDLMQVLSKGPYLLGRTLGDEFRKSQGDGRHAVFYSYDNFLLREDKCATTNNEEWA